MTDDIGMDDIITLYVLQEARQDLKLGQELRAKSVQEVKEFLRQVSPPKKGFFKKICFYTDHRKTSDYQVAQQVLKEKEEYSPSTNT